MASVFPLGRAQANWGSPDTASRLARRMSRHASAALLMFAAVQIVGIILLNDLPGGRMLPYVALALLVLGAVPFARRVEARWQDLEKRALPCPGLRARFRADRSTLWRLALAVPALWLGTFAVAARAGLFL